jgi:IS30 family transposase
MDDAFQAILDSLPPKQPRSKLQPYAELIQELRKRGRSYREIAGILAKRCGVTAGTHTVYNFVRVRAEAPKKPKSARGAAERSSPPPTPSVPGTTAAPPAEGEDEVWQRIQALKQRSAQREGAEKKEFEFDENKPLQLISDSQPKQ